MKRVSKQHAKQASYSIWRYEDQKAILFEKGGGYDPILVHSQKILNKQQTKANKQSLVKH